MCSAMMRECILKKHYGAQRAQKMRKKDVKCQKILDLKISV